MSAFLPIADIQMTACDVRFVPILLQKSKIEQPQKSRESRSLDFSAAASLFNATTEVPDRFWIKRYSISPGLPRCAVQDRPQSRFVLQRWSSSSYRRRNRLAT